MAVVVAADLPCHLDFWHAALAALDVRRRWVATSSTVGLVVTPTADQSGQQLLHLVHVGPAPTAVTLTRDASVAAHSRCRRAAP